MTILNPISEAQVSEELKSLFEKSKQGSGSNVMVRTLAHNPQMMQNFLSFYGAIWKGNIDPKLKEMIRYRVAIAGQCVYWQNSRIAWVKQLGLTEETLQKVENYQQSDLSTVEKACLTLADRMVENNTSENDDLFAILKEEFSESDIVELTLSIGFFIGVGRMNRFLGLEF